MSFSVRKSHWGLTQAQVDSRLTPDLRQAHHDSAAELAGSDREGARATAHPHRVQEQKTSHTRGRHVSQQERTSAPNPNSPKAKGLKCERKDSGSVKCFLLILLHDRKEGQDVEDSV